MKRKEMYVFGNPYLKEDSAALAVAKRLKGVQVTRCTSPDDLLFADGDITILDVVKNTTKPMVITDIMKLKTYNMMSLHDYDVAFFLHLMKEVGQDVDVKIIGIPPDAEPDETAREIQRWI